MKLRYKRHQHRAYQHAIASQKQSVRQRRRTVYAISVVLVAAVGLALAGLPSEDRGGPEIVVRRGNQIALR